MPVSWLRTVTVTPGSTPPCASIDAAANFGRALLAVACAAQQQHREN